MRWFEKLPSILSQELDRYNKLPVSCIAIKLQNMNMREDDATWQHGISSSSSQLLFSLLKVTVLITESAELKPKNN